MKFRKYKIILLLGVFLMLSKITSAFGLSNPLCNEVELSVKKTFPAFKLNYKSVFETSCKFEWHFRDNGYLKNKEGVVLHFFKYGNDKLAQESIRDFIKGVEREADYTKEKNSQPKHLRDDFWDDLYLYKAEQNNSGVLLMRKGKIVFRVVSKNTDVNLAIEEVVKTSKLD